MRGDRGRGGGAHVAGAAAADRGFVADLAAGAEGSTWTSICDFDDPAGVNRSLKNAGDRLPNAVQASLSAGSVVAGDRSPDEGRGPPAGCR